MQKKPPPATVALFHVSPSKNYSSILKHGLLVGKSRSQVKAIWLFRETMFAWALRHVAKHQGCEPGGLAIYSVHAPCNSLRKRRKGIYQCTVDIEPSRVHMIG